MKIKHLFLDTFGLDNVRQAYHDGKDDLRISFYFIVQRKALWLGIYAYDVFI